MVVLRGLLCCLVAFFLLAVFYLRAPYLHDSDSYLHLAVAKLYAEQGVVRALPWPRFSVMSESYGDKELLFHAALVPFVTTGDAAVGGRLALAAFNGIAFAVIAGILWRHAKWVSLLVPAWMFLAAAPWNDRLTRLRPELFALILLLAAAELTVRRRWWWLALVSAAFALSYTAFHALVGIIAIWLLVLRMTERRWEWKALAAAAGGVAAGLAVHPHPIDHLRIWLLQNVTFFRAKAGLDVGSEIFAPPWQDVVLVLAGWWIPVGGLLLFAALRRRDLIRSRELAVYGTASVVFLGLYLAMGRMVIYFVPFATIAAALVAARLTWSRSHALLLAATACVAVVAGALFSMRTEFVASAVSGEAEPVEGHLERFGRVVPPGARVAASWGDTSLFVFAAPQALYLNLYDPLFMAVAHPRAFETQRAMFAGRVVDVPPLLKSALDSDYLALHGQRSYPRLRGVLTGDPRWRVVHAGPNLLLEAREPDGHFLLDWDVSAPGSAPVRYPRSGRPLEGFVELQRVARDGSCRTFTATGDCSGCALRFRAVGRATLRSDGRVVARVDSPRLSDWIGVAPEPRSSLAVELCGSPFAGFFLYAPNAGRTHPVG